jgi:hypothetical protein
MDTKRAKPYPMLISPPHSLPMLPAQNDEETGGIVQPAVASLDVGMLEGLGRRERVGVVCNAIASTFGVYEARAVKESLDWIIYAVNVSLHISVGQTCTDAYGFHCIP